MTRERDGRISLTLALMIGSVAFLLGLVAGDALSHDREPGALAVLATELAPEWVWDREAITFDHLFRKDGGI